MPPAAAVRRDVALSLLRKPNLLLLRFHPGDRVVAGLLALSVLVAAVCLPFAPDLLTGLLMLQTLLLAGFLLSVLGMIIWERSPWVQLVRPAVTVAVVFTLYTSLGQLGLAAMPYRADEALSALDTRLCGVNPTFSLERHVTPGCIEFFSFIYAAFIPYIYVTIVLNCLGRPPLERDQFLTGWVFTYCLSYLGYLLLPARGPGFFHAGDYQVALPAGYFLGVVERGVEATGGLQGAFPSLHVGGSLYLCLFELKTNRLRGLIYLPLVMLIYVATLVLRYHYVVDLIAGTIIAAGCLPLGRSVFLNWARRRQAAGLPALPGGEGDALRAVSPIGGGDSETVFSAP
jgi:membrane-associated phospholipid phosphatase